MKAVVAAIVFSVISLGAANARDGARDTALIEPASSGSPYDYLVHIRKTYDIRYNPEVKEDRLRMARKTLKGRCPATRIIWRKQNKREIWGITSSLPDYIVLVKCS